jgi:hypothetical protein
VCSTEEKSPAAPVKREAKEFLLISRFSFPNYPEALDKQKRGQFRNKGISKELFL